MDAITAMLKYGMAYSLEIEEDFALLPQPLDWHITDRLLGFAVDNLAPTRGACQLYSYLRPYLGLPGLNEIAHAPLPLAGGYLTNRQNRRIERPAANGDYTIHLVLDGAEVALGCASHYLYTLTVCLDCSYQQGIRLLGGLNASVVSALLFWFARSAPKVPLTIGDYVTSICRQRQVNSPTD